MLLQEEARHVKIPMMPKGVEHEELRERARERPARVKIPMMPKGVEHLAAIRNG